MSLRGKTEQLLEEVFGERKDTTPRGRQDGPRRPERSEKPVGSGYRGPDGQMTGRSLSGEKKPKEIPGADKPLAKKDVITEFDSLDDWMLSMLLVAVMHANPGMNQDEALIEGKKWAKELYLPRTNYLWRKQLARIARHGIRAEASKIRREMFKMI